MVLFFTVTLALSIVGLTALIAIKRWELATGKILLQGARPRIERFVERGFVFIETVAPRVLRSLLRHAHRSARTALQRALAWALLLLEQGLEKLLTLLRGPQQRGGKSSASAFLREVAEHKKQLQKDGEGGAIYEE